MSKKQYTEAKKAWNVLHAEEIRAYKRDWARRNYEKNKEKSKANKKKWYDANKEKIAESNKQRCKEHYYKNHEKNKQKKRDDYKKNKAKVLELQKKYYEINKKVINARTYKSKKERISIDPCFKLKNNYATLVRNSLKNKGIKKNTKTYELLGCTPQFFRNYIESLFEPWMTWDNYGMHKNDGIRRWNIDHIVPLSHFNLANTQEAKKAFHYTNCRPYDAQKNISEGDRRK